MKLLSVIAIALLTSATLKAETYPELESYRTLAIETTALTKTATNGSDLAAIDKETRHLIDLGVDIMKLYQTKNPKCSEQFDVMISEVSQIEQMTLQAANTRYHNGTGLPKAPGHCYFGRSQVIHPALNLIRLKSQFNETIRAALLKDLAEVIEHLAKIQKNLDNPPN